MVKWIKSFFCKESSEFRNYEKITDFLGRVANCDLDWTVAFPISDPLILKNWQLDKLRHYPKSIKGEQVLRLAIVDYFLRQNINCSADNIIIDDSVFSILTEIYKILGLDQAGKVLITVPIFGYHYQHCLDNKVKVELLKTTEQENWQINPQKLHEKLRQHRDIKILLCNYPNNPLGKVMDESYARSLAEVLQSYPDLIVISDEILQDMILDKSVKSFSIAALRNMRDRTITLNGVGKSRGLAGIRVSFASVPKDIAEQYPYNLRHPIGMPVINQIIAAQSLLDSPGNRDYLDINIKKYQISIKNIKSEIDLLNKKLNRHFNTSNQIYVKPFIANPESGNIFLVDFSGLKSAVLKNEVTLKTGLDLAELLLARASLAVTPGEYYFLEPDALVLRFCTSISKKDLKDGFARITQALC